MAPLPALVERVVEAMSRLASLGETIEDEWTYVHDLETVWVARLRSVAAERAGGSPDADRASDPTAEVREAVDRLIDEVDRITDPHRAIDWLSTLPMATLVALAEGSW